MSHWLAIVNPNAGGGKAAGVAPQRLAELRGAGLEIDERHTSAPGDATRIARAAADEGQRRFLALGGDGTTYEVLNGLFPRPGGDRPLLGIVPLGTGNSFLRDFGVSSPKEAIARITRGQPTPVDVVRAEHSGGAIHYLNLLSIGFTAEAGELTNRRLKPYGMAGYGMAAVWTALNLQTPTFRHRLDGGALDDRACVLLSFSNSRYTGGIMQISPESDPTDGQLDVVRVAAMGSAGFLWTFPRVFCGTHLTHRSVDSTRAARVDLELDAAVDVMVDGEIEQLQLTALTVLPGALEVMT